MVGLTVVLGVSLLGSAQAQDLKNVPGPWENHMVSLAGRGDKGRDLAVHLLEAGPRDGEPVVLVHGFPDFSYGWRAVIPLLSDEYRVYAPDLRGYAGTDRARKGYDVAGLSADLLSLLDALAREDGWPAGARVHLMGHDWGATVGWRAVNDAPDRFASWTALDVPPLRTLLDAMEASPEQRRYRRFLAQLVSPFSPFILAAYRGERRAEVFYREELVHDEALSPEDMPWYEAAFDQRADTIGPIKLYRQIVFHQRSARHDAETAAKVEVPTLVLWGAQDHYMLSPMAAQSCQQVSARCESEVFPDAGHYLQWDAPEAVVARWHRFVADL